MNSFIYKAMKKANKMNEEGLRTLVMRLFNEYSLLEAVLDSIADGVAILDEHNKIMSINKSLTVILGTSIERDASIEDMVSEEVSSFILSVIQSEEKCKDKEFTLEIREMRKYIELSILPLVKYKKIIGTIIIVSDITERKMTEMKTQRLESLARLANVAASISHEIKNPLAAISIHVQLLEKILHSSPLLFNSQSEKNISEDFKNDSKQREKIEKHLSVVKEEIERLNKIVVDFLFAVRPIKFEFSIVDINAILSSLLETFNDEAVLNNIHFDTKFASFPLLLQGDERFLRQAFMNIILNAFHAMQGKGGCVFIKTYSENSNIIVEISDEGGGIPRHILSNIFEPYFTTKDGGTG